MALCLHERGDQPCQSRNRDLFLTGSPWQGRAGTGSWTHLFCAAKSKLPRASVPPYQFCPSSSCSLSVLMPSCPNLSMSLPKYFICLRACYPCQYHPSCLLQKAKPAQPTKNNLCFKHAHTSAELTGKTLRKAENNEREEHILCFANGHYYQLLQYPVCIPILQIY